jgi:hypothetical protein
MEQKRNKDGVSSNILVLRTDNDEYFYSKLIKLLGDDYPILTLES